MVAASAAVRLLGAGLHSYGFTVFFLPLSQELNLSRTATSFAFSLARAEGAIEGPIVGHMLHRYGPRPVMLVAVALMGVGYLLLSQATSYVTFLIVYTGLDFSRPRRRLHACADDLDQYLVYSLARPRHDDQQRGLRSRRRAARAAAQRDRALLGLALGRRGGGHGVSADRPAACV